MKSMVSRFLVMAFSLALLSGCTSFIRTSTNRFVNDDGEIITVEYGTGKEEHVTTFISPGNGKEMEMKSKLRVRVHMPDGEEFMAFQCMNMLQGGTMYRTDNEKWMFHAAGFVVTVFYRDDDDRPYSRVFQGAICQTPDNRK